MTNPTYEGVPVRADRDGELVGVVAFWRGVRFVSVAVEILVDEAAGVFHERRQLQRRHIVASGIRTIVTLVIYGGLDSCLFEQRCAGFVACEQRPHEFVLDICKVQE